MQGHLSAACKVAYFWNDGSEPLRHNKGHQSLTFLHPPSQMVDFEKETLRWWLSPISWLWSLMRDSMASSTDAIWMRAIFRSFLEVKDKHHIKTPQSKILLAFTLKKFNLLEEFKAFHGASILCKKLLDLFFTYSRPLKVNQKKKKKLLNILQ